MAHNKVVVIPLDSSEEIFRNWTAVNFITTGTNITNDCGGGDEYVKRSDFNPYLFVGAMLCNANRYKLFLSFSAGGLYYEIGDTNRWGQDHCELIGGTETTAIGPYSDTGSGEAGFFRGYLREDFKFETPTAFNAWRTPWYECGISIP